MQFEIGQKVWLSFYESYRTDRYEEITAIGRKWIKLGKYYKFDKDSLDLTDTDTRYGTIGKVYISKEECETEAKLKDTWNTMRMLIYDTRNIPENVTLDAINQAMELLGLKKGG